MKVHSEVFDFLLPEARSSCRRRGSPGQSSCSVFLVLVYCRAQSGRCTDQFKSERIHISEIWFPLFDFAFEIVRL